MFGKGFNTTVSGLVGGSRRRAAFAVIGLAAAGLLLALGGCASGGGKGADSAATQGAGGAGGRPDDPLAGVFGPAPKKTGTQLWADNCSRCHYARPPTFYSGAQWAIVMHHMRSRADLTGEEERQILAFLQAGAGSPD